MYHMLSVHQMEVRGQCLAQGHCQLLFQHQLESFTFHYLLYFVFGDIFCFLDLILLNNAALYFYFIANKNAYNKEKYQF